MRQEPEEDKQELARDAWLLTALFRRAFA